MGYIKQIINKKLKKTKNDTHSVLTDSLFKKMAGQVPPSNLNRFSNTNVIKTTKNNIEWFTEFPLSIPDSEHKTWKKYNNASLDKLSITALLFIWNKVNKSSKVHKELKNYIINIIFTIIKELKYNPIFKENTKYSHTSLHDLDIMINSDINSHTKLLIEKECINRFSSTLSKLQYEKLYDNI
jgi:hypothetical protein